MRVGCLGNISLFAPAAVGAHNVEYRKHPKHVRGSFRPTFEGRKLSCEGFPKGANLSDPSPARRLRFRSVKSGNFSLFDHSTALARE